MRSDLTSSETGSLLHKFRTKRIKFFLEQIDSLKKPISILDVGGEIDFWDKIAPDFYKKAQITLININFLKSSSKKLKYRLVKGDGRDMRRFKDKSFDVVFSNATIEHVPSFRDQKRIADEIRRVSKRYFVQTPNKRFPIEPHFIFPFFQYLPYLIKLFLLTHFKLGFFDKASKHGAEKIIQGIRLLTIKELKTLFPDAKIYREKIFGLTKSFTMYFF